MAISSSSLFICFFGYHYITIAVADRNETALKVPIASGCNRGTDSRNTGSLQSNVFWVYKWFCYVLPSHWPNVWWHQRKILFVVRWRLLCSFQNFQRKRLHVQEIMSRVETSHLKIQPKTRFLRNLVSSFWDTKFHKTGSHQTLEKSNNFEIPSSIFRNRSGAYCVRLFIFEFYTCLTGADGRARWLAEKRRTWVLDRGPLLGFWRAWTTPHERLNFGTFWFNSQGRSIPMRLLKGWDGFYPEIHVEGHPIVYASKSLNKAQRNYGASKLELFAVVFAIKKFQYDRPGSDWSAAENQDQQTHTVGHAARTISI